MKRFIIFVLILFSSISVFAQNEAKIAVSVVIPDDSNIPQVSMAVLQNKMKAMVVQNGYVDMVEQRFVLTASVDVLEKGYNSAGMLMQKMAVTFYIGDVLENKLYATTVLNTMGIGQSDIKVYNMAFQRLSPSAPQIVQLLEQANRQVIEYYTTHYPNLITETNRLVEIGQYDEAIAKLITVPNICQESYKDAQNKCIEIYKQKMEALASQQKAKTDKEGLVLIQQAKAVWSSKQDYETASQALTLLAQIDPESGCIEQANEFIRTINDKLRVDEQHKAAQEKANWEFKMRKYEDNLAMAKQRQADNAAILGTLADRLGRFDINIQKDKTRRWGLAKTK